MILDENIPPFVDWILPALFLFASVAVVVSVVGWLIGFIASASRRGPVEGFYAVAKVIGSAVVDLTHFSFRRTLAIALLAIQEAIRRRVLIGFAVFVLVMLFAGWYLDVKSDSPARLYLSFVLTSSNYLVLILALFLSAFSLPADIKNRTIYTVVTKPVRSLEIVLGRILGFTAVGTLLLIGMCLMSYIFVVRGVSHRHRGEDLSEVTSVVPEGPVSTGQTTLDGHHRHQIEFYEDGSGVTDFTMGHRHTVGQLAGAGDYETSRPLESLQARVPHYARRDMFGNIDLMFLGRDGRPGAGVNVGNELTYRSYIAGDTLAAAIWTFDGVTAERYPNGIDLELNLRVFRTFVGDIETGVLGSMTIRNPNAAAKTRRSEAITFVAKEYTSDKQHIPRKIRALDENGAVADVDLFEDLTDNGVMQVVIQCSDPGQYFGMAPADVYVLDSGGHFWINFIKGYVGIWFQMLLVSTFGVTFSTFLSGAVAMLATLSTIVIGLFHEFIVELFRGELQGGGPLEATIRVIKQENLSVNLEIGSIPLAVVKGIDVVFLWFLGALAVALPNYTSFSTADYVAHGYNIPAVQILMDLLKTGAYVLIVSMIGYFFMKTREIAA